MSSSPKAAPPKGCKHAHVDHFSGLCPHQSNKSCIQSLRCLSADPPACLTFCGLAFVCSFALAASCCLPASMLPCSCLLREAASAALLSSSLCACTQAAGESTGVVPVPEPGSLQRCQGQLKKRAAVILSRDGMQAMRTSLPPHKHSARGAAFCLGCKS